MLYYCTLFSLVGTHGRLFSVNQITLVYSCTFSIKYLGIFFYSNKSPMSNQWVSEWSPSSFDEDFKTALLSGMLLTRIRLASKCKLLTRIRLASKCNLIGCRLYYRLALSIFLLVFFPLLSFSLHRVCLYKRVFPPPPLPPLMCAVAWAGSGGTPLDDGSTRTRMFSEVYRWFWVASRPVLYYKHCVPRTPAAMKVTNQSTTSSSSMLLRDFL